MAAPARSALPIYLASAYTLLVFYASLYPLVGWRDSGIDPLAFLSAGWPRYVTRFDLTVNVLAYLPFGFLWSAVLLQRRLLPVAFVLTVLTGSAFSLSIETLQNFLPTRVPSHLDLACNALGTTLGAAMALRWGRDLLDGGRLHAWRQRRFLPGSHGDAGLVLAGLWLLTQLNPETILFGTGNLRGLLGLPTPLPFAVNDFRIFELASIATHTLAAALIASRLAANHPLLLPLALLVAALTIKSAALLVLMEGAHGLDWITPGSLAGFALGLFAWLVCIPLPASGQQVVAALALMVAAVLANLMPDNPYLEDTLRNWQQGHFFNFNGATRLTTALWPYLALPWLMLAKGKR